jgi:F0F1-type ATP synthase delta subunit
MNTYPALEEFVTRVQRSKGIRSAELRVPKELANNMVLELTKLMLTKAVEVSVSEPSSSVDGGKF